MITRCPWAGGDPLYLAYHDREWGVPLHDSRALFELLMLEGAQAGLSWITILRKRDHYREVFDHFDPARIARYNRRKIEALLKDPGIVRNRAKVEGTVRSAQAYLVIPDFDRYVWQFTGGRVIQNRWGNPGQVPAESPESSALSEDLKRRGFAFCGPTICYAFMQAAGLVNDHLVDCFRYRSLARDRRSRNSAVARL
ncbi:MAG: DNA-3-methyladenine glycosylase I [Acidobacteria bacterium]|nr:DNA-3-methyladenine glycosylase I [Acidobacteriota bacterium]MBI3470671.1 DNA-3-methyladenine glycosylase I [Candidatus Solibacter usitatus]